MASEKEKAKTLLYTRDISRIFKSGHEKIHALDGVTIDVKAGELTLLVGRSGSAKPRC